MPVSIGVARSPSGRCVLDDSLFAPKIHLCVCSVRIIEFAVAAGNGAVAVQDFAECIENEIVAVVQVVAFDSRAVMPSVFTNLMGQPFNGATTDVRIDQCRGIQGSLMRDRSRKDLGL